MHPFHRTALLANVLAADQRRRLVDRADASRQVRASARDDLHPGRAGRRTAADGRERDA